MTNGNSARDAALKKWIKEVDGNSIEVTSLMKSAYRDGWEDCHNFSVCADGGKGDEHDSRMWDNGYSAGIAFERRRNALLDDGGKGEAASDVIEHKGKNLMQIWFECGRDVFAFYDRIMGAAPTPERAQESAGVLTDDQIREIWMRETGTTEQDSPLAILDFARAVLAKKEGA
jgi:hypothetical protein